MKINKRLLSFFLAVLMVFTTFGETVFAVSSSIDTKREKPTTEIEGRVEGNKEVFSFDLEEIKEEEAPKLEKRSLFRMMPFADRSTQDRADQGDTTVKVTATGLNGGKFNWDALPNKEFKITAHWTTTDGETHTKDLTPAITEADTFNYTVGWPVDGTMKGNASLVVDFYQDVKVRVLAAKSTSTPDGAKGLKFEIDLMELAEPRADVKYVDPYGRALEEKDLPAADATMPKVTADELKDVEIDLPKESGQINMRSHDDIDEDELNAASDGLTFKVGGKTDLEKVKIGEKEYLVDISQPDAKKVGQILMVSQPDVVVPPTGDDGKPVEVADGYVRVTFDPTDKAQNQTKTVYDVREGLTWEQAKKADPKVAEPKAPTPKDETKKFVAWKDNGGEGQKLSEKTVTDKVAETTFTATYTDKYTSDNVIPFDPADPDKPGDKDDKNIPKVNPEDDKPIKRDEYVVVGFKVDPKDSGTLTLGDQANKAVISALVKKDTEWAKFTMPTTNDGNDYVFWHWDKAPAEKVADGQVRVAKFIKSGDEIDPNDKNPLPDGFHKVTVAKGTGIAEDALFGKTYAVKEGDTLAKAKFPELKVTDATQYKNPAWNVENPWTVEVADKDLTFTANAVSAVFDKDNVTDMVVKTQPKLNYVEGNATEGKLDLSKLVVTLTDKNGNKQDVPFEKLGEYGITTNPENGTELTVDGNNGKPVVLTKDKLTANTENLVVTKDNTPEEKSEKPEVTQPTEGDKKITGKGVAGSDIVVTDKDGKEIGKTKVGDDGTWEVTVPEDRELKPNEELTVTQTEKDKKPSDTTTTVKEKDQSKIPEVNQPTEGDKKITGKGETGSDIVVTDKDGKKIGETKVKDDGTWEVEVPEDRELKPNEELTVTQTEKDKKPSDTTTTVKEKETSTPQEPSVTYPDTNIDKGETKRVTPDIKGKDGKTTTPESTPEVSQPGHGLIVTPNKDGSIDVTVPKDYDGPGTITVDVTVRVDGKDINTTLTIKVNSGDDSHRPEHDGGDIFDGLFKRHDYTPTYPVKTVVPEKTKEINKLWYIFHIDEYDYEEVRNYNSTSHKMDVTPVIRNERTMLPLRYVAEAINADVIWNAETRTATFTKDGLTASIQIDSDEIVLSNGKTVKMDSKPLNINDRILVSVVNVANVFGLTNGNTLDGVNQDIEWDHDTRTATIYIRR